MLGRSYSSRGIILARKNYGEADRILVILTEKFGKVSFIAKGVRRPTSRKRGHLEVFNLINFSAVNGKGLDIITEAEIIRSCEGIRNNLNKVALAFYFMEVVGKILAERQPHPEVFEILINSLAKLEESKKLKTVRHQFIYQILTALGYWPRNQKLFDHDNKLAEVLERQLFSERVGKKLVAN